FADVANIAYHGVGLPPHCSPGLEVAEFYDPPDTNDPQAMHLAVVIVDPETGCVALRDLYAADDCGGPAVRGGRPRWLLPLAEDGTPTWLHAPPFARRSRTRRRSSLPRRSRRSTRSQPIRSSENIAPTRRNWRRCSPSRPTRRNGRGSWNARCLLPTCRPRLPSTCATFY